MAEILRTPGRRWRCFYGAALVLALGSGPALAVVDIDRADWDNGNRRLTVEGNKDRRATVTVVNAFNPAQVLGRDTDTDDSGWRVRSSNPNPVPCRVRAVESTGSTAERDVRNAPATCAPKAPVQQVCSITVNPTALAFGNVNVGSSAARSTTVTNTGTATCALTVTRTGTTEFALTSPATINVAVGGTATVAATYTPTAAGADTGNLAISGSGITTVNVAMTGTGVQVQQQVCNIAVTPTALAFGDVTVGNAATRTTTVSNSGNATCNVNLQRTGSADFAITSGNSFNLAAGAAQTVSVSYTPAAAGADTGNIAVNSNDPDSPTINVSLSGNGVQQQVQCNPANLNVSINSTAQNGCPDGAVVQQPSVANNNYSIVAINDLGMHCGDLDTRIASILPPFQVLLAQVIQKGATPILNPTGVSIRYSAAANPNDPILQSQVFDGVLANGDTYKTNFWDSLARGTYDPFYPGGLGITPLTTGAFAVTADKGLPVPNVEDLYIGADGVVNSGDEALTAVQHAMPGLTNPYVANVPQTAQEHYVDKPFFVNFPFGYVAEAVNWFEGAGVPFAAFDDNGRENAYPLVRVQAVSGNNVLSTVDTVLPISGEASCTNCHSTNVDYTSVHGTANRTDIPTNRLSAAGLPVATSLDDPDSNMPPKVSLEYAADVNVLRLHDLKHGARYVAPAPANNGTTVPAPCNITANGGDGDANCLTFKAVVEVKPVVCQVCHYTPALDLAHVGPMTGPEGSTANGRNQLSHSSNSNVMHSHHGAIPDLDRNGVAMFPAIPTPTQNNTGVTNQPARLAALENSCYQCHPGTNVQCLRGAMFNGDMLCSDCHGSMAQVGNDFSANVSPTNPGAFVLDQGNFYDPASAQPRTPWANEPGCGSCHTGDVVNNGRPALPAGQSLVVNTVDNLGNTDGIRLRQAFRTGDAKATPIVPTNKRFAEPEVPADFNGFANPGAGNPQLYRVSTGHGGVMCEGCHGATHAEWPNANPNGNDNVTANQLQGHTGVISECSTCHNTAMDTNTSLNGPHGLHSIGGNANSSPPFASSSRHRVLGNNFNNCRTCHGGTSRGNSPGTVLSRTFAPRRINGQTVPAGTPIGCNRCH